MNNEKKRELAVRRSTETTAAEKFRDVRQSILNQFARIHHTVHRIGEGHVNRVVRVCLTKDGKKLLTASWDGTAMIWDCETGLPEGKFSGHEGPIQDLSPTPDERILVTGGDDETVHLWDMASRCCIHTLHCHPGGVDCVLVTGGGKHLIIGGRDCTAVLWCLETRRPVCRHIISHKDKFHQYACHGMAKWP